jgi:clan AA aspartic protease (TIGR02281 family)
MQVFLGIVMLLVGAAVSAVAMLGLLGAGMLRHGPPVLVAVMAVALVVLPAKALSASRKGDAKFRPLATGVGLLLWSVTLLVTFPLYFPGERGDSLSLGFAAISPWTDGWVDAEWGLTIDEWLPAIKGARPVPEAARSDPPERPPPMLPKATKTGKAAPAKSAADDSDTVVLPTERYKGALHLPVSVEGPKRLAEVDMLYDTGATLTTLNRATLRKIGVKIPKDAPVMKMHTAAGERETRVVLVDRLWVGGLEVEGITVSVCDECAANGAVGLLGLNVSNRFLVTVDAARKEISLRPRGGRSDRSADVGPWIDLEAQGTRWPDGRAEVVIEATNRSSRWIQRLTIAINCEETRFADIHDIGPGQLGRVEVSVDSQAGCAAFQVQLDGAAW